MINFLLQYGALLNQLNRLLGVRFIPGSSSYDSLLSLSAKSILELGNRGDYKTQQYEMGKLAFLVQNLLDIEAKRPDILKTIRKKMKKAIKNDGTYLGLRFEINIASALINQDIKITYHDKPDFILSTKISRDKLFIECGSAHLSKATNGDVLYKISSVLHEKSQKPYANCKTGLFIDVTNLAYTSLKNTIPHVDDKIRKLVSNKIASLPYGSVILFMYIVNHDLNRYESSYIRIDSPNIDLDLQSFFHLHFPFGTHWVTKLNMLSEG